MPARFGTLNEWSPFSTTWSAAGASSFARIGRSSSGVPNASREPCTNSIGARIFDRCFARSASGHRFAADRELVAAELLVPAHGRDCGAVASFQLRAWIGNATAVLDIGKIERDRIDAARREPGREAHQERAFLPGAGAVRQHERNARALPRVRRIGERAHIFAGRDVDAKRVRHNARQLVTYLRSLDQLAHVFTDATDTSAARARIPGNSAR